MSKCPTPITCEVNQICKASGLDQLGYSLIRVERKSTTTSTFKSCLLISVVFQTNYITTLNF
ncbi:hypothetical protein HanRHA438_Chr10g0439441 [Helianthus annuus]|nr:hypothetical protein HanRHA438_Chr10g0439441 [Helianthus annuus]